MRIKTTFLVLLLISFFSCDKSEEKLTETPVAEDPTEDPVVEDEKKPELTVTGFTDIIETTSTISISISDESTVETKVMLREQEIAASTDKQFDVSINPYSIPVGTTEYIIYSKDAKGNETTETYTVEIKHLLFTYEAVNFENTFELTRWVFFNNLMGEELGVIELVAGVHKVYSEDIIEDDSILMSYANYVRFSIGDFEDLNVTTYKIPLGQDRVEQNPSTPTEYTSTLNLKLGGVPFENGTPQYNAIGHNYYMTTYDGTEEYTNLNIIHNPDSDIYIKTNSWGSTPYFDGRKENYKYVKVTPEEANMTVELEADDLIEATEYKRLDIPDHEAGSLYFSRRGFVGLSEMENFQGHNIYDVSEYFDTASDYIDLPRISDFSHYIDYMSFTRNGKRFQTDIYNDVLDITMPDWQVSASISEELVELQASENDVDYYHVFLNKRENSEDYSKSWNKSWNYYIFNDFVESKAMPRLDLPDVITNSIEDSFFKQTDDLEVSGYTAHNYINIDSHEQLRDWFALNKNAPQVQNRSRKIISFSVPSSSDKVKIYKRSEKVMHNEYWDTNKLYRHGMEETYPKMKR